MSDKDVLVESIRSQREILGFVLETLENKQELEPRDYVLCEETAAMVGRSLEKIRRFSIDSFVQEKLWGLRACI